MKNLEQIRAAAALEPAKSLDKAAVNKLPAMIMSNGLLATIAFCHSESSGGNRSHMANALLATAKHLAGQNLAAACADDLMAFAQDLSGQDSHHLQRATAEALAYIAYLRRFAKKDRNVPGE
jgi:CRISPR type III-B/RAMP module-associated protein Cmr5